MNDLKPSPARRATLGAVMIALTFLALYGATVLPSGRLGTYFLASVFVAGLTCEDMPLTAFVAFLGTSLLAWLMIPDKFALLPYFAFLGWYGIVKYLLERRLKGIVLWVCKFVVFNAAAAILFWTITKFFAFPIAVQLPIGIAILILEIAFVGYDLLYTMVATYYYSRIRSRILSIKH